MIYRREEYIEENPSDEKYRVKRIDALEPIDGSSKKFIGHVAIGLQTTMGVQQIPVSFEIEAKTIKEAFERFVATAEPRIQEELDHIEDEMQRLQREASSRIVRPGEVGMPANGGVIDFKNLKR